MEILDELIDKRLANLKASIVAGEYADEDTFKADLDRHVNMLISLAVLSSIKKDDAVEYIQKHFTEEAEKEYDKLKRELVEMPTWYAFAEQQEEIEALIEAGKLDEADEKIANIKLILENEETVKGLIKEGFCVQEDVDYFMKAACPHFDELKDQKIAEMPEELNFGERLKRGISFVFTGRSPYDGKNVKIKKEKKKEDSKKAQLIAWAKKHKVALCALGAAALLAGGIFIGKHNQHNKANATDEDLDMSGVETQSDSVEMETFEVDEFHNFNMNDQETHTLKLELLAKALMERGVRVVSDEEYVELSNQGILAVTSEQLDNWLISMNLEDITDLTFTKLMADSNTDKEELSSDFLIVSNILGTIYTTKEETPFIYEFISNKEHSAYIKAYEEAIIQNQKGDKEALVELIQSRVKNPVAGRSAGPRGMLSTALIYQQANVYNAQVVGQDIMDLYNINNDCKTETKATFYSDDWAEYMRKVNSKMEVAITYTGSETATYVEYFKTLTDAQNDNKVFIESQVLPFLELNNVQLGEWDVIDEIENNRTVNAPSTGTKTTNQQTVSSPIETKTITKKPTTPEELAVKEKTETKLSEKNKQALKDSVSDYAKENGGQVLESGNGDLVIYVPGQEPIVVNGSTMGAYDASKDYQGATYTDYEDYSNNHSSQVSHVEGVGDVVVTKEDQIEFIVPPTWTEVDEKGNELTYTPDFNTVSTDQSDIDEIISDNGMEDWVTTEEGEIHYSDVDDDIPDLTEPSYAGTDGQQAVDENANVPVESSATQETPGDQQPPSVLDTVDQDVYQGLTEEEKKELEQMLNAGEEPVAGQIVEESFSDVVYGNYTVPQLMNNPALCKNIPESILKNDFPEIWTVYQNWLAEQANIEDQPHNEQSEEVVESTGNDITAQIAALEGVKAELTGASLETGNVEKTM